MPAMEGPKLGNTKSTDAICWAHETEFLLDKFRIVCKKKKKIAISVFRVMFSCKHFFFLSLSQHTAVGVTVSKF